MRVVYVIPIPVGMTAFVWSRIKHPVDICVYAMIYLRVTIVKTKSLTTAQKSLAPQELSAHLVHLLVCL
uniref:Secreted protein n=1 Tax=Acrobeloides nanus TaxID=290746 RepID=A0A914DTZ2_9BILA